MTPATRPVSWIKAARKDFEAFPEGVKSICLVALTMAAEGAKADIAKPLHGMGSGVFEIALQFRGGPFVWCTQSNSLKMSGSCMRFRKNPGGASQPLSTKSISSRTA